MINKTVKCEAGPTGPRRTSIINNISYASTPLGEIARPEEGIDRVKRGQGRRGGPAD